MRVDIPEFKKEMAIHNYKSITALAEASGVNRNTISDMLNGRVFPSADVMCRLKETFGWSGETAGRIFFAP